MSRKRIKTSLYLADREAGMTYREIAEKYGVSHQCVAQCCAQTTKGFRPYTESQVAFPYLRKWLNENKVTRAEFIRRMGKVPYSTEITRLSIWFRGDADPSKLQIDRMLAVTGLTYEELFWEGDENA